MTWNGLFSPRIRKHRLYTGDITNHITVGAITQLDAEEEEDLIGAEEDAEIEIAVIGDGGISWLVEITFIDNGDSVYEFVIRMDETPTNDQAAELIGDWVLENINHNTD